MLSDYHWSITDGDRLMHTKKMSKNFVTGQNTKKELCPICIVRNEEFVMEKDEASKSMICKNCGYIIPTHMDAVQDSELEAGNQPDTSVPYMKTLPSFTKKRTIRNVSDIYNNPADAWLSGP